MKTFKNPISVVVGAARNVASRFKARGWQVACLGSLAILMSIGPSDACAAAPSGAVKLSKSKLSKKSGFYCGNVKSNSWIPGRLLSGGYFYSYQAEKANLLKQMKKASKTRKDALRTQISSLNDLISTRSTQCIRGGKALRFDLSDAVGLALKPTTGRASMHSVKGFSQSSSNLAKVDNAGQQSKAVVSGSATIQRFLIAPNDKLYVLFESPTNLNDTSKSGTCRLAEVDKLTGQPTCIDSSLSSISWSAGNPWYPAASNEAIQFDQQGSIYYRGKTESDSTVLRKYSESKHTDLVVDSNVDVYDFLVLPSGDALIYGQTRSSGTKWLRRVSAAGSLSTIASIANCNSGLVFLRRLADGTVVTLIDDCAFEKGTYTIDQQTWQISRATRVPLEGVLSAMRLDSLCVTPKEEIFGSVALSVPTGGIRMGLVKMFPGPSSHPSISVAHVTVLKNTLSSLFISGLNANGQNILTLLDTTDNSEIQLIGPENEIEIFRLNFVASSNKLMFDGLRFSDNKYVIGQYDFNAMRFSASQTGSTKLVDFQTFQQ